MLTSVATSAHSRPLIDWSVIDSNGRREYQAEIRINLVFFILFYFFCFCPIISSCNVCPLHCPTITGSFHLSAQSLPENRLSKHAHLTCILTAVFSGFGITAMTAFFCFFSVPHRLWVSSHAQAGRRAAACSSLTQTKSPLWNTTLPVR